MYKKNGSAVVEKRRTIRIYELVGEACITLDDGQEVYNQIHPKLIADEPVSLDFAGVNVFSAPFFNTAIGRLAEDINPQAVNCLIDNISNLDPAWIDMLKQIVDNSRHYYSDEKTRQAVDDVLQERSLNSCSL